MRGSSTSAPEIITNTGTAQMKPAFSTTASHQPRWPSRAGFVTMAPKVWMLTTPMIATTRSTSRLQRRSRGVEVTGQC